jgi:hypothetical protein
MSGWEERRWASTQTPLSISRPTASASPVLGDADSDADRVGLDAVAVGQQDAVRPATDAGDLGHLDTAAQVNPVLDVQVGKDLGGLAAQHA